MKIYYAGNCLIRLGLGSSEETVKVENVLQSFFYKKEVLKIIDIKRKKHENKKDRASRNLIQN